jgi:hypothetical protein
VAVATEFVAGGLAGVFSAVIVLITGGEVNAFGLQIAAIKDPKKAKLLGATLWLLGIAFIAIGFVVNQQADSSSQRNASRQISESRSPLPGGSAARSNVSPSRSSSPPVVAQNGTADVNSSSARIQWGPGSGLAKVGLLLSSVRNFLSLKETQDRG